MLGLLSLLCSGAFRVKGLEFRVKGLGLVRPLRCFGLNAFAV